MTKNDKSMPTWSTASSIKIQPNNSDQFVLTVKISVKKLIIMEIYLKCLVCTAHCVISINIWNRDKLCSNQIHWFSHTVLGGME